MGRAGEKLAAAFKPDAAAGACPGPGRGGTGAGGTGAAARARAAWQIPRC
jgi:hypothetical protein